MPIHFMSLFKISAKVAKLREKDEELWAQVFDNFNHLVNWRKVSDPSMGWFRTVPSNGEKCSSTLWVRGSISRQNLFGIPPWQVSRKWANAIGLMLTVMVLNFPRPNQHIYQNILRAW